MNKIKNCRKINLTKIVDAHDGVLSVASAQNEIPFNIKRVYYIYHFESQKSVRGHHAHKCLEQVLFCISGSFCIKLDDGENQYQYLMNNPNEGLFIGNNLWHTMQDFTNDCIIIVLASDYYDESDYIRDYKEFKNYLNNNHFEN
jgi:dTDP-4-dehydrorhamnose 3,5-epimerase-like enzyme